MTLTDDEREKMLADAWAKACEERDAAVADLNFILPDHAVLMDENYTLTAERDAAVAEVARLRGALERIASACIKTCDSRVMALAALSPPPADKETP